MTENRAMMLAAETLALAAAKVKELETEIARLRQQVAQWETTGDQLSAMIEALTASPNQATVLLHLFHDHLHDTGQKPDFDAWAAWQVSLARARIKQEVN